MIKYIGSKRTLIPVILEVVRRATNACSVIDLFSGTSRVGHALKAAGYRVLSNDHNAYALTLARCYVEADAEDILEDARKLIREFNTMRGTPGYFTETFCRESRFFQPKNGERIDAIREAMIAKGLSPELEAVVLVSLMEAADRVDSTTGLQMAYLKSWASRSYNDLELRVPEVLPRAIHGKGQATGLDALEAVKQLEADVAYIDPPYNQHSYLGNYHIWESLVRWDKPEVYGIACKRIDVRQRQSVFNSRPRFLEAMRELLVHARAPVLVVSFNNEGFLARETLESELTTLWNGAGKITTIENDFKRYVGAQIGIHNLRGEKVGKISHLRNKEFIYVVSRDDLTAKLAPMASAQRRQLSLIDHDAGYAIDGDA
ncbi:Site-specific DNA-methyltransferase (adenine-specific) [mine drainage metagenome]|uniref:site-specific DNA-methyltransferase (adenine-specific) n=4 Tax=mine drainage metagenome TaxID=410659 RepID=T1D1N8_9ZZZZ